MMINFVELAGARPTSGRSEAASVSQVHVIDRGGGGGGGRGQRDCSALASLALTYLA